MEIRQDIKDFVKCLQKSGIIANIKLNKAQYEQIQLVCDMSEEQVRETKSINVVMIHDEYTDWIETYNKK